MPSYLDYQIFSEKKPSPETSTLTFKYNLTDSYFNKFIMLWTSMFNEAVSIDTSPIIG